MDSEQRIWTWSSQSLGLKWKEKDFKSMKLTNVHLLNIHEIWIHINGVLMSGISLTLTTTLVRDKHSYLEVLVHEFLARMFWCHCALGKQNGIIDTHLWLLGFERIVSFTSCWSTWLLMSNNNLEQKRSTLALRHLAKCALLKYHNCYCTVFS